MRKYWYYYVGIILSLYASCVVAQALRPRDPWVFRSVMDDVPRALTIAFHHDVWAMYDTETGDLKKLWQGGGIFKGEVYNAEKIVQPISTGHYYLAQPKDFDPVFYTYENGKWQKSIDATIKEYSYDAELVSLRHEIALANGTKAVVLEQPSYDPKTKKFTRAFTIVEGITPIFIFIRIDDMDSYKDFTSRGILRITEKGERVLVNNRKKYYMAGMLQLKDYSEVSVILHPIQNP